MSKLFKNGIETVGGRSIEAGTGFGDEPYKIEQRWKRPETQDGYQQALQVQSTPDLPVRLKQLTWQSIILRSRFSLYQSVEY